jgi:hypothetical protein
VNPTFAVEVAGFDTKIARSVKVSLSDMFEALGEIETTDVNGLLTRPEPGVAIAIEPISAEVVASAIAGETDKTPKPREATATSATRLKVVFVDICFLSISRSREFPPVGFG